MHSLPCRFHAALHSIHAGFTLEMVYLTTEICQLMRACFSKVLAGAYV